MTFARKYQPVITRPKQMGFCKVLALVVMFS